MDDIQQLLQKYHKYKYKILKYSHNNFGIIHPASIGSSIKHEKFDSDIFHPASIKK